MGVRWANCTTRTGWREGSRLQRQSSESRGLGSSAAGTLQHLAFNVDSLEDLVGMRDRIRTMRASGGLVQGHTDLVAKPVDEEMLVIDASDDDPWGASEPVVVETPAEDGTVTMGSEAWS